MSVKIRQRFRDHRLDRYYTAGRIWQRFRVHEEKDLGYTCPRVVVDIMVVMAMRGRRRRAWAVARLGRGGAARGDVGG